MMSWWLLNSRDTQGSDRIHFRIQAGANSLDGVYTYTQQTGFEVCPDRVLVLGT